MLARGLGRSPLASSPGGRSLTGEPLASLARLAYLATLATLVVACGARSSLDERDGRGGALAGAGGSGGHAGMGGLGGLGGLGGTGGALDPVALCARAASCGDTEATWPAFTASQCLDGLARFGWHFSSPATLPDPALVERLSACAGAADCASYRACFGGDWLGLSRCREGATCVGDGELLQAWQGGPSFDCASLGATCADLWSGAARACCNAEPCTTSTPIVCDGASASWCGGWGERVAFDCAASGRLCAEGADPWQGPCVGAGAPCAEGTPITCAGSVATYCSGGALASHDCGTTVFRTGCAEGGLDPCRPAGDECDEWLLETCEGDALVVCVDGLLTPVSCLDLGFAGCAEQPTGARCVE